MTIRFVATGFSLVVLLLSGCISLGPDYQKPEAEVEPDWVDIEDARVTSEPATDPKWWESAFQDPELDKLVEAALQQNLTLRSAGLRVLQSQQQLAIAVGNQYPQQQQNLFRFLMLDEHLVLFLGLLQVLQPLLYQKKMHQHM